MAPEEQLNQPFKVKDCALIALATGTRAYTLRELRDRLESVDASSIYYHVWGGLLRPRFDDPEYHNDFASWTARSLHDNVLAERLSVIDPVEFSDMEALRQEFVEVIEERLDESEYLQWAKAQAPFNFLTSQIVVFDTHRELREPSELAKEIPNMSLGSIFYHFIDARRRTPENVDDFRYWLEGFDDEYAELCALIATVDPYFPTLAELREQLASLFSTYFGGAEK